MRLAMSNSLAKTFPHSTTSSSLGSFSKKFRSFTNLFNVNQKFLESQLITLKKGEVFQVALEIQELHVLSGTAWVTIDGKDIILNSGEKAVVSSIQDFAILSALGNMPLVAVLKV